MRPQWSCFSLGCGNARDVGVDSCQAPVMKKVLRGKDVSLSRCARTCHLRRRLCIALDVMAVHHSAGGSDMSANSQPDGLPSCSQQSSGGVYGPFWCQAPVAIREHSILLTFCYLAWSFAWCRNTQHRVSVDRHCDNLRSESLDVAGFFQQELHPSDTKWPSTE